MNKYHKLNYLLILLLVIGVSFFVVSNIKTIIKIRAFIVLSGSMAPEIPVGSVVAVKPENSYSTGDIITFWQDTKENIVTHRIIESIDQKGIYYSDKNFITKGDANNIADTKKVNSKNIVGQVYITVPYLGYLVNHIKTTKGFILFIVIPATIIVYEELRKIYREIINKIKKTSIFKSELLFKYNKKIAIVNTLTVLIVTSSIFILFSQTVSFFSDSEKAQGNVFSASTVFGTPTPTPLPIAQTLVVNEFLWNSSCTPNPETKFWLELFNGSTGQINLKNWRFTDGNNNVIQISNANAYIESGKYVLITKSGSTFSSSCYANPGDVNVLNLGGNPSFLPSVTGGVIKLEKPIDSTFEIVDRIEYGPSLNGGVLNTAVDQSIARDPNALDSALGDTFVVSDFQIKISPSPGLPTP